jgi:hypothetical protein
VGSSGFLQKLVTEGLAHSRRSYIASVVVDLIHHSRPQDGGGRLGNYLVLSDPESGKRILLASSQPAGRGAIAQSVMFLKITPRSDHGG